MFDLPITIAPPRAAASRRPHRPPAPVAQDRRAGRRPHARRRDVVLQRDRDPEQRRRSPPSSSRRSRRRPRPGRLAEDGDEGVELRFEAVDPVELGCDELDRRARRRGSAADLGDRREEELLVSHVPIVARTAAPSAGRRARPPTAAPPAAPATAAASPSRARRRPRPRRPALVGATPSLVTAPPARAGRRERWITGCSVPPATTRRSFRKAPTPSSGCRRDEHVRDVASSTSPTSSAIPSHSAPVQLARRAGPGP